MRFYLVLAMFFLFSCQSDSNKNSFLFQNKDDVEYKKILSFFGDSLTSHFPNNYIFNSGKYIDTFGFHNTFSFFLQDIDSDLQHFKYKRRINLEDSCLIAINDFITYNTQGDSFDDYKTKINLNCKCKEYPVPNFYFMEYSKTVGLSKLPKDFKLYVVDSKNGVFSKKIDVNKSSLPNRIKHGFSKGYAVSKERSTVIYWVIIW